MLRLHSVATITSSKGGGERHLLIFHREPCGKNQGHPCNQGLKVRKVERGGLCGVLRAIECI